LTTILSDNIRKILSIICAYRTRFCRNNRPITIKIQKEGETWEYSTDGGATFKSSTVGSFTLDDGTYVAGAIQIKKLDATGNLLGVTKINENSDIIIDTEKSVFTSSTTANVEKDTDASEIIYTAKTLTIIV
jgi:hypothetical protein